MSNINNQEIVNSMVNKEKLIEIFINYFGEKYRPKIENLIKETLYTPITHNSIETYKLRMEIYLKHSELKNFQTETLVDFLIDSRLCNNQQNLERFINSPIVSALGYNSDEIVQINKANNSLQIINRIKLNELISKIRTVFKNTDLNNLILETRTDERRNELKDFNEHKQLILKVNKFVSHYQSLFEHVNISLSKEQLNSFRNETKNFFENKISPREFEVIVLKILNLEKCVYFDSSMAQSSKSSIENQKINDLQNNSKAYLEENEKRKNELKETLIEYNFNEIEQIRTCMTYDDSHAGGSIEPATADRPPVCFLPIATPLHAVIHETMHVISLHKNPNQEDNKQEYIVGFFKPDNIDKTLAINEYVTEYLSQDLMTTQKNSLDELNYPFANQFTCSYTPGVNILNNFYLGGGFLDSYKDVLKQCYISKDPSILKDIIGEENYNELLELTSKYFECNEKEHLKIINEQIIAKNKKDSSIEQKKSPVKKILLTLSKKIFQKHPQAELTNISSAADVLQFVDKIEELELPLNTNNYVKVLKNMVVLCNLLVENKNELVQGNKIDLSQELEVLTWKNSTNKLNQNIV